ncbi:hypothetical protein D3C71_1682670 [compost metagenome]
MVTVGQRRPQAGEGGKACRDTVDDTRGHAMGAQEFHFFAASAKNEGITAFEAHDLLAVLHLLQHQPLDEGLWCALAAAALAHMHNAGAGGSPFQYRVVHQVVHQQYRGPPDGFGGSDGQQVWVARSGTHQRAVARQWLGCSG